MITLSTQLIQVNQLKPHEEISLENYEVVLASIIKDQKIHTPLIIDKATYVILDGHHRFSIAKHLKLDYLPCILVDYFDDTIVSVFPRRETVPVSKDLVIKAGTSGTLFPHKSTRHVINIDYIITPYALDALSEHS